MKYIHQLGSALTKGKTRKRQRRPDQYESREECMASQWSDNGNYWIVWVGRTGTIEPASIYSRSWTVPCGLARYAYRGETATDHRPCPPFTNTRAFGLLSDLTDLLANRPCILMPFTSISTVFSLHSLFIRIRIPTHPANRFLYYGSRVVSR